MVIHFFDKDVMLNEARRINSEVFSIPEWFSLSVHAAITQYGGVGKTELMTALANRAERERRRQEVCFG